MTQKKQASKKTYLKDYQQPNFFIPQTQLDVTIGEAYTDVKATLTVESNPNNPSNTLVLDGVNIEVVGVKVDGKTLSDNAYNITEDKSQANKVVGQLSIPNVPKSFTLEITNRIKPQENNSKGGFYKAGNAFLTQCEAEDFRRISYYLDRPDVMSEFRVNMTADKAKYPQLLSNGNKVGSADNGDGTHTVSWHDPSLKPSYLFAMVAGEFNLLEGQFTTRSGRDVTLQIFADTDVPYSEMQHALDSLIESMDYDEKRFDREYDLDLYMIVATSHFNMGAMENKGLNIFNTRFVLGSPKTASDEALQRIADVIFHEYAHNWSGNRVTCRDWFQLSLKEGLTVFRDAQFNADHTSHAIKRIEDVKLLTSAQFAEDAGSVAHPIRPHFFTTINNFYTLTVYEKGAEIIYMLYSMLGKDGFKQALNLYFDRHDGQAVTTEEFVKAMEDGGKVDLTQFRNWYDQGGTPLLKVQTAYDPKGKTFSVEIAQSVRHLDGYPKPKPFHIPVAIGLLDSQGRNMLEKEASDVYCDGTVVVDITKEKQTIVFGNISEKPVLSFLRNFSAPVKVEMEQTTDELLHLMHYDNDPYNKWEACNRLVTAELKRLIKAYEDGQALVLNSQLIQTMRELLNDSNLEQDMKRLMLTLPTESALHGQYATIPVDAVHHARKAAKQQLAKALEGDFLSCYQALSVNTASERALRNLCLSYLCAVDGVKHLNLAQSQFDNANNFTLEGAAFRSIVDGCDKKLKSKTLASYVQKWQNNTDVMDTWFTVQALQDVDNILDVIQQLTQSPAYDDTNPNKIRSVWGAFTQNYVHFHNVDGSGYSALSDEILRINDFNPEAAAKLMTPFTQAKSLDSKRQSLIKSEVERITQHPGLSKDVTEKAEEILKTLA